MNNIKILIGNKNKLWGGWYRQDKVFYGEILIGRIQVKRQHKRTESSTLCEFENSGVVGNDIRWLIRRALELGKV